MIRFYALLATCLLAVAPPAMAVPLTFTVSKGNEPAILFNCQPTAPSGNCGLETPKFDLDEDDDYVLDPEAAFRFLKFKTRDLGESDDTNEENEDDGTDDASDDETTSASGSFTTTVRLLLKIGTTFERALESTAIGTYETEDGDIRAFSLIWSAIPNILIDGKGPFAVAFEDINISGEQRYRKKGWEDEVYVRATITPVPLPAGAMLLLSGIGLLGAARLRRRKAT